MKKVFLLIISGIIISWLGEFTQTENILLFIILGVFYYINEKIVQSTKSIDEFTPFSITIIPNWNELLRDYGLIKDGDDEAWANIRKSISDAGSNYSIFEQGVSFTILKQEKELESTTAPGLVFDNRHKRFLSEVDMRESLEPIKIQHGKNSSINFTPKFIVKWAVEGYGLYITTPESQNRVILLGDDEDLVEIAKIPYAEFYRYYGHASNEKIEMLQNKKLKDAGWEREEHEMDLLHLQTELHHKYFDVLYHSI